ncbi:hypothetical protein CEXT_195721 [Caerostris extrusa]|uniref:Uncharacterized protein n=1 Tax=Caerostris extrusa TaxID=172846 RepID=A0AAV4NZY6_CAEEX|nr:hypothetical protein CEXT_195721 [Caerostris extrusa]
MHHESMISKRSNKSRRTPRRKLLLKLKTLSPLKRPRKELITDLACMGIASLLIALFAHNLQDSNKILLKTSLFPIISDMANPLVTSNSYEELDKIDDNMEVTLISLLLKFFLLR